MGRLPPPAAAAASVLFLLASLWLLFGRPARHPTPPPSAGSAYFRSPAAEAAYRTTRRLTLATPPPGDVPPPPSGAAPPPVPPVAGDITRRPWAARIIVSERRKLLYCPIPKAANSNWKYLLRRLEGYGDYANLSKLHTPALSGLRYLSDYSAGEAAALLGDPTYTKFVFVRDPYTRLLSAYMDKIASTEGVFVHAELRGFLAHLMGWRWVKARLASVGGGLGAVDGASGGTDVAAGGAAGGDAGGADAGGGGGHGLGGGIERAPRPSFRSFVDELLKAPPATMNAHWAPQSLLCGFGEMPYDFVGRFEHLAADAAALLAHIGAPAGVAFPSQADIGFPPSGAEAVAEDFWSLELMLKARLVYDVDFHTLGYDAV